MIISASRRTDIPAFFADWFYKRIEKGYVLVRNPQNFYQVSKIDLSPDIVDCFVFWTKNPKVFIENLNLLKDYNYYFQYTITGYGSKLEPNIPPLSTSIRSFAKLSRILGPKRVIWRYDPIIITDELSFNFHINNFLNIASCLSGLTHRCVISFVDYYKKLLKNLSSIKHTNPSHNQLLLLSEELYNIGNKYHINLVTCAEEIDLSFQGISHGKCIDDKLIEEISGFSLQVGKDKYQRKECGCIASNDIGAYNTCPHGCLYCYANYDMNQVRNNYSKHKKESDLIYGDLTDKDRVTNRKVVSCKILQQSLLKKHNRRDF